jgi:hypothetical protein
MGHLNNIYSLGSHKQLLVDQKIGDLLSWTSFNGIAAS